MTSENWKWWPWKLGVGFVHSSFSSLRYSSLKGPRLAKGAFRFRSIVGRERRRPQCRRHSLRVVARDEAACSGTEQPCLLVRQVLVVWSFLRLHTTKRFGHSLAQRLGAGKLLRQARWRRFTPSRVLRFQVLDGRFHTVQEPPHPLGIVGTVSGGVTSDSGPVHRLKGQVHLPGLDRSAYCATHQISHPVSVGPVEPPQGVVVRRLHPCHI